MFFVSSGHPSPLCLKKGSYRSDTGFRAVGHVQIVSPVVLNGLAITGLFKIVACKEQDISVFPMCIPVWALWIIINNDHVLLWHFILCKSVISSDYWPILGYKYRIRLITCRYSLLHLIMELLVLVTHNIINSFHYCV